MSIIKLELSIDTKNVDQLQSAIEVLNVFLKEHSSDKNPPDETEQKSKPQRRTRAAAQKPKDEKPKEEAKQEKPKEESSNESEYKVDDVRSLLAKKVGNHRDDIKAKLTELGAKNVTNLEASKYEEFIEFLNSL